MAFTTFQQRTIGAWRGLGYRVVSQTLMHDHSYEMVIRRPNGKPLVVTLLPNGRYHSVGPGRDRSVA